MSWKHRNFHSCCAFMKILMFSTHSMKYIWYSPQKSKYPLFIGKPIATCDFPMWYRPHVSPSLTLWIGLCCMDFGLSNTVFGLCWSTQDYISSGARGLLINLSLHLNPHFVYGSSKLSVWPVCAYAQTGQSLHCWWCDKARIFLLVDLQTILL